MESSKELKPVEDIENLILLVRGQRVIIDSDLARLYGVQTKALNQAIKRNLEKFPNDFMFQLSESEKNQLVTDCDRFKNIKHSTVLPHVFTEYGAIMAANVLNSSKAIHASIYVVRTFVKFRELLSSNRLLALKLNELERKLSNHDEAIVSIVKAIQEITAPIIPKKRRRIGF